MTVNSSASKITYAGNGSTTAFSFGFSTPDAQSIKVVTFDNLGNAFPQAPGSYSVILNPLVGANPTPTGGTVNYPLTGPPLPVGTSIAIVRQLEVIQPVSLANQGTLYPVVIEQEFDYLTMLDQGGSENTSRAFTANILDPIPLPTVPVAQRAGHFVFFDANGDLTPGDPPSGTAIISAAMQPVVAAPTIPIAVELLGIQDLIDALFQTGDLKPTHRTLADPGWIMWIDGTIGDLTSGSTVRANADTLALFSLYYNSYNDTDCPLFTSAGAATTRAVQGTATVAYNNHCRMSLPKMAGRSLGIAGTGMGLTARHIGERVGVESVTPSVATMAAHQHGSNFVGGALLSDVSGIIAFNNITFDGPGSVSDSITSFAGGSQPFNIMQPTTYINVMVKL